MSDLTPLPVTTSLKPLSLAGARIRQAVRKRPLYPRLYRAHIGAESYGTERTAFVEAVSHQAAARKIANAVAALELRLPETIEERIYNVTSAQEELIDEGLSEDLEMRLFEIGWCGNMPTAFVEDPLFLVTAPALIRKWAQISGKAVSHD